VNLLRLGSETSSVLRADRCSCSACVCADDDAWCAKYEAPEAPEPGAAELSVPPAGGAGGGSSSGGAAVAAVAATGVAGAAEVID